MTGRHHHHFFFIFKVGWLVMIAICTLETVARTLAYPRKAGVDCTPFPGLFFPVCVCVLADDEGERAVVLVVLLPLFVLPSQGSGCNISLSLCLSLSLSPYSSSHA